MAEDGAAVAAGRWDTDPVRPNPGPGSWIDPGPVASPERDDSPPRAERRSGGDCDPLATLGARRKAPAAPDDRVRDWSADVRRTTAEPVDLSRTVR